MNIPSDIEQKFKDESDPNVQEHLLPHLDLIFRCAYRMTGKRQDAEDLTQETFYNAIKNFQQIKDVAKSKYWLFSIMRNLFLKEVGKQKKRIHLEYDSVSNLISGHTNLELEFLKDEAGNSVRNALSTLDERLRQPVEMFYFQRMSYKEISGALDLPMGTVMSRIARAKVHIKRKLSSQDI